jgi:alpha-L-arabinofuranosidase
METNDAGTDEFLALTGYLGAEPYITVNSGGSRRWWRLWRAR